VTRAKISVTAERRIGRWAVVVDVVVDVVLCCARRRSR
jgi:hypothetical protein